MTLIKQRQIKNLKKKININNKNGCWEWTASLNNWGYGRFMMGRVGTNAHRAAYKLLIKYNIGNLFVLHKCDNRKCVNPDHLFLGTAKDNAQDRDRKGRSGWQTKNWTPHNKGKHEGTIKGRGRGIWLVESKCTYCKSNLLRSPTDLRRYRPFCGAGCINKFRAA